MKKLIVPRKFVSLMPPAVGSCFRRWAEYMYSSVQFNMPDSVMHSTAHSERVLLYAMLMVPRVFPDDEQALTTLAHAAIFHDTRRENEMKDSGHGARAAAYYEEFCREHSELTFIPAAAAIMRYHDRRDELGEEAIAQEFPDSAERVRLLYHLFKDADALDRWRLGPRGLNPDFLRTDEAIHLVGFARKLVDVTRPIDW